MKYEGKKLFIKQKGLLLIAVYLLLSMVILVLTDQPEQSATESEKAAYTFYLKKLVGPLTKEKDQFLKEESERLNTTQIALDKLYDQYYDGKVAEGNFKIQRAALEGKLAHKQGFEAIYEQYIFVRENKKQRYFIGVNGWSGLLSHDELDYLLLILLLLLLTPIFCAEYASGMASLSITMKKGGRRQALDKIFLGILTVAGLCGVTSGMRYCFFAVKYGLSHGNYPLQSLHYFGTSEKQMTLLQSFLTISLMKMLGFIFFALLIFFFSVIIKQYALTLFASTALILVPYVGLDDSAAKSLYTGPLGLMTAKHFLRGNLLSMDLSSGKKQLLFREIKTNEVILLIGVVVLLMVGLVLLVLRVRSNSWEKRRRKGRTMVAAIVLILTVTSGCTKKETTFLKDACVYNYGDSYSYRDKTEYIYWDETDVYHPRLMRQELKTGQVQQLVRRPVITALDKEIISPIFGRGDLIYYTRFHTDYTSVKSRVDRMSVIEVDTKTFLERVIYEKKVGKQEWLLGAVSKVANDEMDSEMLLLFLNNEYLYFSGTKLIQIERCTGKVKQLNIGSDHYTSFDGHKIYYIGPRYQLSYYDDRTGVYGENTDIIAAKFILATGDYVYYANREDENKVYRYHQKTGEKKKILDHSIWSFRCDEEYLYYQLSAEGEELKVIR